MVLVFEAIFRLRVKCFTAAGKYEVRRGLMKPAWNTEVRFESWPHSVQISKPQVKAMSLETISRVVKSEKN